MIENQYNETVSVKRLADVEGTNKRTFQTHIESLDCCIQPLDNQISQDIEGGFGKDWLMFCTPADIQEGDRIIRGSKEYRITAVESYDFMNQPHMEISIRIFES
jgi:hypothetical protein